jgi:molybdopterin converting factor small subunit
MQIEVRIFGNLREYVKGSEHPLLIALHEGATVDDLLKAVCIPLRKTKLIFVNARQENAEHRLQDGDRVGIFPPSGGG